MERSIDADTQKRAEEAMVKEASEITYLKYYTKYEVKLIPTTERYLQSFVA